MAFRVSNLTIIDDSRNLLNIINSDVAGIITASRFISTVTTGTSPISVASSTVVTNLNADFLDGQSGVYYLTADNLTGTAPASVITQSNGLSVNGNLSVSGNLSIGGTTTFINADVVTVEDKNIILGLTTSSTPTDTTANFGGISIASTEGTPIINIPTIAGVNTAPSTYKHFSWVKSGTFSGFQQDSWLTNYAISIGNTASVRANSRLTVGTGLTVYDSYLDAQNIRTGSIDVAGIVTFRSGISDKNGVVGSANSVLTADGAGGWLWKSLDALGSIQGIIINNDTTTSTPKNILFTGSTSGTVSTQDVTSTKLTFTASTGSLGVNTSSPTQNLHVQGNVRITGGIYDNNNNVGSASSVLTANGSGGFTWAPVTSTGAISGVSVTDDNTGLRYPMFAADTSSSTAAFFLDKTSIVYNTSTNRLGIGSLSPSATLDVIGDVKVVGVITATDFNSSSDIKLKTNINNVENPLDKILKINGVTFEWKETGKKSVGVIAQEIETILPELVSESDGSKKVNYNGLIGLLIECIKEQQKQIDELKLRS